MGIVLVKNSLAYCHAHLPEEKLSKSRKRPLSKYTPPCHHTGCVVPNLFSPYLNHQGLKAPDSPVSQLSKTVHASTCKSQPCGPCLHLPSPAIEVLVVDMMKSTKLSHVVG